jgi:hypothetical protein
MDIIIRDRCLCTAAPSFRGPYSPVVALFLAANVVAPEFRAGTAIRIQWRKCWRSKRATRSASAALIGRIRKVE